MNEQAPRRWFRFSLRTMFVVVTVLCVWLGWESSVVRQRQGVLKELRASPGFEITTAEEWAGRFPPNAPHPPPAKIALVRTWLGDKAIQEISYYRHFQGESNSLLRRAATTFPEAQVSEREIPLQPCHPGCFPSGTLVDTPVGPRLIEEIQVGDLLTTIRPGGQSAESKVQSVFVTSNQIWKVETADGVLFTTQIQPLCLADERIVPAGKLEPGDRILCRKEGEIREVEVLRVSATEEVARVFNLVLGDSEIFIAGGFLARSKPPAEGAAAR